MDPIVVLVSGVAGLFAGMISTGAGGYQSSQSELEVLVQESQRNEVQGRMILSERDKLIEFYRSEGYTHGEAIAMVKRIYEEAESPVEDSALEELGLTPVEFGNPVKSGMLCGVSFGLAAIIPLFPFAVKTLKVTNSLIISIIATLASLFVLGAMKTIFSRKKWIRSGLDMVLFGASGTAVTYLIGNLFSYII
jgi:VIT1/CCC1 family predicted Fe2+/Mn2+ transporter